jgi:hypothetical protein
MNHYNDTMGAAAAIGIGCRRSRRSRTDLVHQHQIWGILKLIFLLVVSDIFSIIYGMTSFPLTFIFFKMVKTTNQSFFGESLKHDFQTGLATNPWLKTICYWYAEIGSLLPLLSWLLMMLNTPLSTSKFFWCQSITFNTHSLWLYCLWITHDTEV